MHVDHLYNFEGGQGDLGGGGAAQMGQMSKTARNFIKNFGKLAVLTYACNNLTNLEHEVHPFTGNGNVESGLKKL